MKKSAFYFIGALICMTSLADAEATMTLTNEQVDDTHYNKIERYYELENGRTLYNEIEIPEPFQASIKKAKDPLLEAKKKLTYLYVNEKLPKHLAELNNTYLLDFSNDVTFAVTTEYADTFKLQKEKAMRYANEPNAKLDVLLKEIELKDYKSIEKKRTFATYDEKDWVKKTWWEKTLKFLIPVAIVSVMLAAIMMIFIKTRGR